jgi:hypothetical protein
MDDAMLYPLVLNSINAVSGAINSVFKFSFLAGTFKYKIPKLLQLVNQFITHGLILLQQMENLFQIVWPVGAGTVTFTIMLPNRFYTISDLNSYLQKYYITNGLYLIKASGH